MWGYGGVKRYGPVVGVNWYRVEDIAAELHAGDLYARTKHPATSHPRRRFFSCLIWRVR